MPLRSLYEYVSSLTRPIRYTEETRGGESCAADSDATGLVRIHDCPNPPDSLHRGNRRREVAVPQAVMQRGLYEYVGCLTRPVTIYGGNRRWGRAVPQTVMQRGLYQYVSSLTRPASPTCVGEGNR